MKLVLVEFWPKKWGISLYHRLKFSQFSKVDRFLLSLYFQFGENFADHLIDWIFEECQVCEEY